jgi:hypothetical protein
VIWTVGDRGPNIAGDEMASIAGVALPACKEVRNGQVYPAPDYAPSIYRIMLLDDGRFRVTDVITLKDRDGRPLNGMPNLLRTATTEQPLDGKGNRLAQDVHGINAKGIVRLADGSLWIGDENGPSMAHFAADGRMIVRHVRAGTEGDFAGARYEVQGTPGDPRQAADQPRHRVHGGLAGRALPVCHDAEAARQSGRRRVRAARNTRLLKSSARPCDCWANTRLQAGRSEELSPRSVGQAKRSADQRVDGGWIDRLIVLERTEHTTKLYEVALAEPTDIAGSGWGTIPRRGRPSSRPTPHRRHQAPLQATQARHRRRPRDRRQERGHGAAGRRRTRHHQRRRFRHRRRQDPDRRADGAGIRRQ